MIRKTLLLLFSLMITPSLALADLSGDWEADDGGKYYLKQMGAMLYWYGENAENRPAWSNVYVGRISGQRISGDWVDVPKGRTRSHGRLSLEIRERGNVLVATRKTGGFGGSRWTRVGYRPTPTPASPSGGSVEEDCVSFNPSTATVSRIQGNWKIVDGSHWLFDFGNKQDEARQALRVIKHYRANRSCYVGRPSPSFSYLRVGNRTPTGQLSGEDCVSLNPSTATVSRTQGNWKIVDGSHWLFDFGNNRSEANQSLAIIKKYRFTHSCFVGRPNPSFQYLRH
jgi:hypothetical protein